MLRRNISLRFVTVVEFTGDAQNNFFFDLFGTDTFAGGDGYDEISYRLLIGGASVVIDIGAGTAVDSNGRIDLFSSVEFAERLSAADPRGQQLRPGLPAQVVIPTRTRTALQYLLEPLDQSIWTSFRES